MYKRILFFVFLIGGCINVKAKDIIIKNPGSYRNIQTLIQQAVDSAENGDVIILPAGDFAINETVLITKFISIRGQGILKTILYWNKPIPQPGQRSSSGELAIFNFKIKNTQPSGIRVSGICFNGVMTTLRPGMEKTLSGFRELTWCNVLDLPLNIAGLNILAMQVFPCFTWIHLPMVLFVKTSFITMP